jgi:hypothetical protein
VKSDVERLGTPKGDHAVRGLIDDEIARVQAQPLPDLPGDRHLAFPGQAADMHFTSPLLFLDFL